MLETLRVKNLAIVENVRIEFRRGLNVITGETGAGKSILVGALGLILGERADKTMIRAGEDRCGVEAGFTLTESAEIDALLEELGIEPCDDGRLIIRRIISTSGAGKVIVNDCPAGVQTLRRIGDLLVDMHGPHDHQSLLSKEFQLALLDAFGHLWESRAGYEDVYREIVDLERRRKELECDEQEVAQQIDLLTYQVKEIEDAKLEETDEEELVREHSVVANARRVLEIADTLRMALTEDEASAFNALVLAQKALDELSEILPEASAWKDEAQSLAMQIQELSNTAGSAIQDVDADPGRMQYLDDRLALLHALKRKYGGSVSEILDFLARSKERLHALETRGQQIAEIDAELKLKRKEADKQGRRLTGKRSKAAEELASVITGELRTLGFPHGAFDVALAAAPPGPSGMDDVEFGFAPNVGEPMRPLRAIASSGEISRVMLATKAVLAKHDRIPVLIFDEIDANVGGEMGNAIGDKLETVAENHQVLCITHLPQVAAHGSTHFVVAKEVRDARTRTQIAPVTQDERIQEIARMLGGGDLSAVSLEHAREMLGQARGR